MMFYSDYISDEQLVKAVQNSSHLDRCYVVTQEKTWTGEKSGSLNLDLLNRIQKDVHNVFTIHLDDELLKFNDKTTPPIRESEARNYILNLARKESFDFMIIQDTDEFMIREEYEDFIQRYIPDMTNAGYDSCGIRWKNFWKDWQHLLICEEELIPGWPGEWATFGINLHTDIKFTKNRYHTHSNKCGVLQPWYLYHGCYVLTDDQVKKKITTWGHSKDSDYAGLSKWYEEKWLKWNENTTDLHPSDKPWLWKKTIRYDGPLPKELINYKV